MKTPMTEPVWSRQDSELHLLMPQPPYVRRFSAGYIKRHTRKHTYFVHRKKDRPQVFHDLDEAKAWLLAVARLEN